MIVTGIVKCLHCGHVAGEWAGRAGSPLLAGGLRPQNAEYEMSALVRCLRCSGPVFLDEVVAVRSSTRLRRIARLRRQIADLEARRKPRTAA